jgi:hypothetical protein
MKHNNVCMYDVFIWNWFKNIIRDKTIFIMNCINESIGDERLKWSGASKGSNACEGD